MILWVAPRPTRRLPRSSTPIPKRKQPFVQMRDVLDGLVLPPTAPSGCRWHVEASWQDGSGNLRLDVNSSGRALLLLFLFFDVDHTDARRGCTWGHTSTCRRCWPRPGRRWREFFELAAEAEAASAHRQVALATGEFEPDGPARWTKPSAARPDCSEIPK